MNPVQGYAAHSATDKLVPYSFERREPRDNDVVIDIQYCGVCHSDIHSVRNEWGGAKYPLVPGHEIVGRVTKVGANVTRFKVGDLAGVGCMVDSCQDCPSCNKGLEQYCERGFVGTYNSMGKDGKITMGGYSTSIVVQEEFTLHISDKLDLRKVAPLLCAGITTYSPLRNWKVSKGQRVGVVGLGGLGHMAVKFANSFGAHVVVFTTSANKKEDAMRLGAHEVVISKNEDEMKEQMNRFDFIIDTVSAPHDVNPFVQCLKLNGVMVFVGVPEKPPVIQPFALIGKRRSVAGSLIGGIKETQEMLDYCAEHGITSDVEMIKMSEINTAYERMIKSDVKYRFVVDMSSLKN